ncbi:MAG: citrate lyase subunit alpha [Bacilli bacterium]
MKILNKFISANEYKNYKRKLINEVINNEAPVICKSIEDLFSHLNIFDNMTISYHHHLRNGDMCVNMIVDYINDNYSNTLNVAASSIFPAHSSLLKLIESSRLNNIYTNYINGPVAKAVSAGGLNELLFMHTHGGRSRAIESGDIKIDIAFLAVSECDKAGNANGINGKSACGALGYAISDSMYAKTKVLITDNLVDTCEYVSINGKYVDYILVVDSIGDPNGIVSGTTQVTKNPIGLKIARDSASLVSEVNLIEDGFSFQTGAGGTSLAVADYLKAIMKKRQVKGSFASGGITGYFTSMLEEGLFDMLWDVQCFDLSAISSLQNNRNHLEMSASKYGNPFDECVVNDLDVVVLGATEVDLNFNVNVVTDSNNVLMGGSGGHSDTAYGAKLTIITTPLIKGRNPVIKDVVNTITTPGESVDAIVTERGIAINPLRKDLLDKLKNTNLNIVSIENLQKIAYDMCGVPKNVKKSNKLIGHVVYRDGSIIDSIWESE